MEICIRDNVHTRNRISDLIENRFANRYAVRQSTVCIYRHIT